MHRQNVRFLCCFNKNKYWQRELNSTTGVTRTVPASCLPKFSRHTFSTSSVSSFETGKCVIYSLRSPKGCTRRTLRLAESYLKALAFMGKTHNASSTLADPALNADRIYSPTKVSCYSRPLLPLALVACTRTVGVSRMLQHLNSLHSDRYSWDMVQFGKGGYSYVVRVQFTHAPAARQ